MRFSPTVRPPNTSRPSGTCAIPSAMRRGARTRANDARPKRMSPLWKRTSPEIVLSSVDLPAPFAPTSATVSPSATVERHVTQDGRRAVAGLDVAQRQHHDRRRRAADVRFDHRAVGLDLGGRSACDQPAGVEHQHAVGDTHHQRHVVLDDEHRRAGVVNGDAAGARAARSRRRSGRPPARRAAASAAARSALVPARRSSAYRAGAPSRRGPRRPRSPPRRAGRERAPSSCALRCGRRAARTHATRSARARRCASRPTRSRAPSSRERRAPFGTCARGRDARSRRCSCRRAASPKNDADPASLRYKLVSRLNSVLFPAPFGPMSAVSVPAGTSNETSSIATTPPNALRNPRTWSAAAATSDVIARSHHRCHPEPPPLSS